MTETTNYGLKLMERADSGNWITGGMNGNTTKIDEVMKQLSVQLTNANGLITGLQNQLDTTNGSMTAQGGQITELGNLINGANGNIATLTQAVEDLQTKQPTGNVYEFEKDVTDSSKWVWKIKMQRIGKLVMGTLFMAYNSRDIVSADELDILLKLPNVPKDFLPYLGCKSLPNSFATNPNYNIVTDSNINDYIVCVPIGDKIKIKVVSFDDFFTNGMPTTFENIESCVKDSGTLTIHALADKIMDIENDPLVKRVTSLYTTANNNPYYCFWRDFYYVGN